MLVSALNRYLELHAARLGKVGRADIEDIASTKSLDLLRAAESGSWDLQGRSCQELPAFLSTVARNGLVDHLRAAQRFVELPDTVAYGIQGGEGDLMNSLPVNPPDCAAECREFSTALRDCVSALPDRARRVWFLRVFYDLPSLEIAAHPEVQLKRGNVDVILQRARLTVTKCMATKGHRTEDMPAGVFAELWSVFRLPGGSVAE